jgi:phosphate transport system protein
MIEALKTRNKELAMHVIKKDDLIDEMERKIERECLITIARQQPIATDLRDIISILKIVTDLERIADHCEDISEYVVRLTEKQPFLKLEFLPLMADAVSLMISDTIDAYIRKDVELAKEIIQRDDVIDDYFNKLMNKLIQIMQEDSELIQDSTNYILINKYLERMADHATNIAEWIIYYGTGELQ